ncbi:MAG: MFS transporter, partial [Rhodospirillales bacterium]
MWIAIKSAWALLFGIALMMIGNGLQGTLLGVRAGTENFGEIITGLVMSGYYVGFFAGSVIVPRVVSQVGHIRVFAALATIASSTILIHAVFIEPTLWFVMRVLTGFAYAGLYIVSESWLNEVATNKTRGTLLSIYMVISMGALGLGQFFLVASDPNGFVLFIIISVLISLSLIPLVISTARAPGFDKPSRISLREIYEACPTGVVASFLNGMGFGAILSLGAVYGQGVGFTIAEISGFMAVVFIAPVFGAAYWVRGR